MICSHGGAWRRKRSHNINWHHMARLGTCMKYKGQFIQVCFKLVLCFTPLSCIHFWLLQKRCWACSKMCSFINSFWLYFNFCLIACLLWKNSGQLLEHFQKLQCIPKPMLMTWHFQRWLDFTPVSLTLCSVFDLQLMTNFKLLDLLSALLKRSIQSYKLQIPRNIDLLISEC